MTVPAPRLIDCHVHLQDPVLAEQIVPVLERAAAAGVERFVTNGSCEEDWPAVLDLAKRFHQVIPCFGLHPWFIHQRTPDWLRALERHLEAVPSAVGEIGLDRGKEGLDEKAQEEAFRAQLAVARRLRRPVMIHCVQAWGWLLEILRSEPPLPSGMLIHAFGGPTEFIRPLADRGGWFSFAGDTFEPRKERKREALREAPLDRLLLETDAPDMLPPPPYRRSSVRWNDKEKNEPANLREILRGAAELRGESEDRLAEAVWENGRRFLGDLLKDPSAGR